MVVTPRFLLLVVRNAEPVFRAAFKGSLHLRKFVRGKFCIRSYLDLLSVSGGRSAREPNLMKQQSRQNSNPSALDDQTWRQDFSRTEHAKRATPMRPSAFSIYKAIVPSLYRCSSKYLSYTGIPILSVIWEYRSQPCLLSHLSCHKHCVQCGYLVTAILTA